VFVVVVVVFCVLAIRIVSQAGTLDTCQEQKCYQKNINATITTFLIVFMSHSFIVGLSSIVTMAYILLSRFYLLLSFSFSLSLFSSPCLYMYLSVFHCPCWKTGN